MKKKIVAGIIFIFVFVIALFYIALQLAQTEIKNKLTQHNVHFQQLELHLLPSPHLQLSGVSWQHHNNLKITAQQIRLQLDFQSLFNGENSHKKLHIEQANIWHSGQTQPDFPQLNAQIEGNIWRDKSAVKLTDFSANIQLAKPILFNTSTLALRIAEGHIQPISTQHYQNTFTEVWLNGEFFPQITNQLQWTADQQRLDVQLQHKNAPPSQLQLQLQRQGNSHKQVQLQAQQLVIAQWEKMLNLPHLLTGTANATGNLVLHENKIAQGAVQLHLNQGEINGINLLQTIERHLPFKLHHNQTHQNKGKTPFDQLNAAVSWNRQQLQLQNLHLQNSSLIVTGQGQANLNQRHCDFQLNISLADPRWQHLQLPLHFYDQCHAPKYKVGIDKNLRQGLKELLKSKLGL